MSLSSYKSALAVRKQVQFDNLNEALFEWGYEWNGGLNDLFAPDSLTEWEITKIEEFASKETVAKILEGKTRGAKYLGWQIWSAGKGNYDINKICSDWAALKDIRHWMSQQPIEDLKKMDLLVVFQEYNNGDCIEHYRFQPQKLLGIGIRFAWQAERFAELYKEMCVKGRPWGSCYQPSRAKIKKMALTQNYNRLPLWVKKIIVNSCQKVENDRVGSIWRLIDCAKAWKHAPGLPKNIAEKIGRMPIKSRIIANFAWNKANSGNPLSHNHEYNYEKWDNYVPRSEIIQSFWNEFRRLSKLTILEVLRKRFNNFNFSHQYNTLRVLAEHSLGLPFGFLIEVWGSYRTATLDKVIEKMTGYLNPADVCQHYFGCKGKATIKAFSNCIGKNQWKWASALAAGKPDLVQKYLSLPTCIEFEPDAVELLKGLGDGPALRMVATTTFKVRGEVKPVETFHIKDSGYLWNNIQEKPELGRVRCWLSLHEDLTRQFVKEQPNESLKVHPGWQQLNGLCAVDGTWEIELPSDTSTLKYWGEKLHHCVGGYGPKINNGDCVIFAIKINGIVKYTVEMCPISGGRWDCEQFYGERNSHPPYELKSNVLGALAQVIGIKDYSQNFWLH